MNQSINQLIEESIQLELNVGELYLLFYRLFPEDGHFWWRLAIEEENHAALLKTVRQMEQLDVDIPPDLFPESLQDLKGANRMIRQAILDFEKNPDRTAAFQTAYRLETSAGEYHYDAFMKHAPDSRVTSIFKHLNGDDVDHANRIREYMENRHIPMEG